MLRIDDGADTTCAACAGPAASEEIASDEAPAKNEARESSAMREKIPTPPDATFRSRRSAS
jgi:hypothetical protein